MACTNRGSYVLAEKLLSHVNSFNMFKSDHFFIMGIPYFPLSPPIKIGVSPRTETPVCINYQ